MELAKKIQTVLLPRKPELDGYEISAHMTPADEVGGDYYDIISVDGNNWVVIGDVSGHGVPAGLMMMMVQTALQTIIRIKPEINPRQLLDLANRSLSYNNKLMGEDRYMTITVFLISRDGHIMFSGRHQDIMVYRAATDDIDIIETDGMWLGFDIDMGRDKTVKNMKLNKGDAMLLFTDGITESRKKESMGNDVVKAEDVFGYEKLIGLFKDNAKESAEQIKNKILDE